jgi:hypothetical protein
MTTNPSHSFSQALRVACALCAAALLFFLVYSAPHRVHHIFEQAEMASHRSEHDHHGRSERNETSSNNSDCAFQTTATRCAIGLSALVHPLTPTQVVETLVVFQEKTHSQQLLSSAFPIRARPRV